MNRGPLAFSGTGNSSDVVTHAGAEPRRIFSDWEILVRSDLQLANRPLFQMEQIAFGGLGSVRGYRTYLTITDDGFLASGELRIPVGRIRLPYLADTDEAGIVQLVPFYDFALDGHDKFTSRLFRFGVRRRLRLLVEYDLHEPGAVADAAAPDGHR